MTRTGPGTPHTLVAAALAVFAAGVFLPVLNLGFVWDDFAYLHYNPLFSSGLTIEATWRALVTFHSANWHPVTWLSHLADLALFGMEPAGHHLVNLLLHAANTALLFALLAAYTGLVWQPAAVAALFAVHPLRVESVAWVAERKDLLAALLSLCTLIAWMRHLRDPARRGLGGAIALFALALSAKPMAVTVPVLMLVLDWWPLGRLRGRASLLSLAREKLPFAALAAASAAVTLVAQSSAMAVDGYPLLGRLANALRSCVVYLRAAAWPADLAAFYPLRDVPLPLAAGSALILATVTTLAIRTRLQRPWLLAGWGWYLVSLLPVIGLVQVGVQAMADRYTYLPLTGILLAAVWSIADMARRWSVPTAVLVVLMCALLVPLSAVTRALIPSWKDNVALWSRAESISPGSSRIHINLGNALGEYGDLTGAEHFLRLAKRESPRDPQALAALGALLVYTGRADEATPLLEQALQWRQTESTAAMWLGKASDRRGESESAIVYYRRALSSNPELVPALNDLGVLLGRQGKFAESAALLRRALRLQPENAVALFNLGRALELAGDLRGALEHYEAALRVEPGNPETGAMRDRVRAILAGGQASGR